MIDLFEFISNLATVIGIPMAIIIFLYEKRKERIKNDLESFFQSNDRYMQFLNKVFENPELNCGEFRNNDPDVKNSKFNVKQLTLYTQLIMILEQTWYTYKRSGFKSKRNNIWKTWEQAYCFWSGREDFRSAWKIINPNTESTFRKYMDELIIKNKRNNNRQC
jgi:hypothetical protein